MIFLCHSCQAFFQGFIHIHHFLFLDRGDLMETSNILSDAFSNIYCFLDDFFLGSDGNSILIMIEKQFKCSPDIATIGMRWFHNHISFRDFMAVLWLLHKIVFGTGWHSDLSIINSNLFITSKIPINKCNHKLNYRLYLFIISAWNFSFAIMKKSTRFRKTISSMGDNRLRIR